MRPATRTVGLAASSVTASADPYFSNSSGGVAVQSNLCGYTSCPRASISASFFCRCKNWSVGSKGYSGISLAKSKGSITAGYRTGKEPAELQFKGIGGTHFPLMESTLQPRRGTGLRNGFFLPSFREPKNGIGRAAFSQAEVRPKRANVQIRTVPKKPETCHLWYTPALCGGAPLGEPRAKRVGQRSRTVLEDWVAWIPNEMDQLFDATRSELESSTSILNVTLDEALSLCKGGQFDYAKDRAIVFESLFDRLAVRVDHVVCAIKDHGTHFGIVPNVIPLSPSNFRGTTAQKVSLMNNVLSKVVFRERTRFFHKLDSLDEIVKELQKEERAIVSEMSEGTTEFPDQAWKQLEVLSYDLNTCMGETTVILKSFFCALPPEELDTFREKLVKLVPSIFTAASGEAPFFGN